MNTLANRPHFADNLPTPPPRRPWWAQRESGPSLGCTDRCEVRERWHGSTLYSRTITHHHSAAGDVRVCPGEFKADGSYGPHCRDVA